MMKREAEGREGVTSHTHTVEWRMKEKEEEEEEEEREERVQCSVRHYELRVTNPTWPPVRGRKKKT